MADQRQSILFQVPFDIRVEIYQWVIRGLAFGPCCPNSPPYDSHFLAGLLLTCRRVRDECEPFVYQEMEVMVKRSQTDIVSFTNDVSQRAQHSVSNLRLIIAPGDAWREASLTWIEHLEMVCDFIADYHPDLRQVAINLSPYIVDGDFEHQMGLQDLPRTKVSFTLTIEVHFFHKLKGHGFEPKRYEIDLLNQLMQYIDTRKTPHIPERSQEYIWREDGPGMTASIPLPRNNEDIDSD